MTEHKTSGQEISMPPTPVTQSTWGQDVPVGLKKEIQMVVRNMYGDQIKGLEVESYRMCWDAVTPSQHWIISPHPHCESLFIAGGGSFHSWKFLPTIGKYVVEMMRGELSGEMASRWAWNRGNDGGSCPMYIPKRDLKDIEGYKDIEGAVGHNM